MTIAELREKLVEKSNEAERYINDVTQGYAKYAWEKYKLGVDYAIYLIDNNKT